MFERPGAAAITAGAWQRAEIDVSRFGGQQARIVVEAADADTGSLIEAAIDDIKITRAG